MINTKIIREWINIIQETASNDVDVYEIYSRDFYGLTFSELREKVRQKLNTWRNTKRVFHNRNTNINISLTKDGIKKSTSSSGEELLKLLFLLPYILTHGTFIREQNPRKYSEKSLEKVFNFKAKVIIDGIQREVFAVVKQQREGNNFKNYHYSLAYLSEDKPN